MGQTKHSAIEFIVTDDNHKVLNTFVREMEIPLNKLTFSELIEIYNAGRFHYTHDTRKPRDRDACPTLPALRTIHCCYYNKAGKMLAVSEQFPHDTDYGWRWFCLARFWLVPSKENEFSLHHVVDRYRKTFQGEGSGEVGSEPPLSELTLGLCLKGSGVNITLDLCEYIILFIPFLHKKINL